MPFSRYQYMVFLAALEENCAWYLHRIPSSFPRFSLLRLICSDLSITQTFYDFPWMLELSEVNCKIYTVKFQKLFFMRSRMFYQIWRAPLGPLLKNHGTAKNNSKTNNCKRTELFFLLKVNNRFSQFWFKTDIRMWKIRETVNCKDEKTKKSHTVKFRK